MKVHETSEETFNNYQINDEEKHDGANAASYPPMGNKKKRKRTRKRTFSCHCGRESYKVNGVH